MPLSLRRRDGMECRVRVASDRPRLFVQCRFPYAKTERMFDVNERLTVFYGDWIVIVPRCFVVSFWVFVFVGRVVGYGLSACTMGWLYFLAYLLYGLVSVLVFFTKHICFPNSPTRSSPRTTLAATPRSVLG